MAASSDEHPRPSKIICVDPSDLQPSHEAPPVDAASGIPTALRAFVVCREPRITVIPDFLSPLECDHLVSLAHGSWVPSLVGRAADSTSTQYAKGDLENGLSQTRTSWSCMLRYAQTAVVERLEHRLASIAGLPLAQLERMNMVRYAPGELFGEHHDGKFRPRTIFVYLNDLPEDAQEGDTYFPVLGLSFRPRRGAAVMWSNVSVDGDGESIEDSRVLHAGRAPSLGIKYGVNCFFGARAVRHLLPTPSNTPIDACASFDTATLTADSAAEAEGPSTFTAFRLSVDPQLVCVKGVLSGEEVAHVCGLAASGAIVRAIDVTPPALARGTRTVRTFDLGETPTLAAIEERLADIAGFGLQHLGPVRLVLPAADIQLENRGCGQKSAYACLSEEEYVVFPRLGLRLKLYAGDVLMWTNVYWDDDGIASEDMRTLTCHHGSARADNNFECEALVGLSVFFHEHPVRDQKALRTFVIDPSLPELCQ